MSHLGDRVTDLVDGRLAPHAADRAVAHLARCRACRDQVETERLTKQRLAALPAPPPGDDLVSRLLTMGGPAGPMPPRPAHVPGTPKVPALPGPGRPGAARTDAARPLGTRPTASGPGAGRSGRGARTRVRRGRMAVAVLGALSAVGVGVGGLLLAPASGAPVTPPLDSFVVEHAATTANLPFADLPAGWATGTLTAVAGDGR